MPILKDLTKKLKKFTQDATEKFKEPKSIEVEGVLQKIIVAINNFNSIDVVTEQDIKEFREKIKSIYKSTCLRKYYNPGENDKSTYKRSGLAGIIFQELYIYLTQKFRQSINNADHTAEWLLIKDKTKLKESFKSTYKAKFGSDEAWVESILYNEKVLTKLFNIGKCVQIGQASTPPKGPAPQPPKATASKKPQPSISEHLIHSIETIFDSLDFTLPLVRNEESELKELKKYFKDNAQSTVNKIMNLKNDQARNDWVKYFIDKPFSKIMTYEEFRNYLYSKDGLFQEMLKDGIMPNAPIPRNLPKGVKLPAQKQPSDKTVTSASEPPKKPQPPIPQQPTGQGNAKPTAEQLKNASGSLKKVANPMTSKRKSSVVEQVFENTTNSPMFKRAQQQNQTQDEDDDDAWTD